MTCPQCGRALQADARFCSGCGTAVVRSCPECATELEADARFCRRCGYRLEDDEGDSAERPVAAESAAAPRESGRERKVATLLFADIVGFTDMNEAHDPELVSSLVSRAFDRLSREVRRYEGTIEKFAGDALLAVFGVPAAHEDDPERAVRAALEMQSVAGAMAAEPDGAPELQLRIGIATGEVLADPARASTERDLFVTGDAVNTAARLQGAAEPGTVIVGSTTYASTRDAIDYEELPPVDLKGKELPVAAWRAVSVKAGRGGRRARLGLQAPMVGRDAELALLKETVRRTVEEAKPHMVTVIGSAGVGKSRLTWELEKYLDGLPGVFHWRKGRCLAYSGSSFGPIADVAKVDARISDDDAPDTARQKLAARLDELDLGVERDGIRDALEAVLAIGELRERPRDELFEAWRRYLGAIAEVAPLILVVEDIHWADDGVLAFLDFLARWGEGAMVIVCLARHELLEHRSSWGGGLPNATTIVLEPLGEDASSALMEGLLDGGVPETLGARIIELAEGNPLFVEEMVRMLVDRGVLRFSDGRWELAGAVEEVEIPSSVQAVLAARLDTLPAAEKRIAQDAAVVGRIFWDVVVAHLSGSSRSPADELIRRLRVKDLVVQRKPSSLAEATEYGFRHVLIRDVAYDSLPKRDRSRLHRDIAIWAEAELADRIDEFSELIASHLAAAVAYEEEFSADPQDLRAIRRMAMDASLRAARRASAMSQVEHANHWRRMSVDLAWKLDAPPREVAQLALEYAGEAWESVEPRDRNGVVARAAEAMLTLEDPTAADAELLALLRDERGHALYDMGDVVGSRKMLQAAIDELESGPPTPARATLLNRLGWTYWRAGPVEEAVPILRRAIEEAKASDGATTLAHATHDLGVALAFLDRHDEAIDLLEDSYRQAQALQDRGLLMRCYINIPAVRQARGDAIPEVWEMVEEGLVLARRSAASHTVAWLAGNLADFMMESGRLHEAVDCLDEAIAHGEIVNSGHRSAKLCRRSLVKRELGDVNGADRDLDQASRMGLSQERQVAQDYPLSQAARRWPDDPRGALAFLLDWADDNPDGATVHFHVAIEVARMALRLDDDDALAQAADISARVGASDTSPVHRANADWIEGLAISKDHHVVEAAADVFEAIGYRVHAADARADAALLAGRTGLATDAGRQAVEFYQDVGMYPRLGPPPETRWLDPSREREAAST